jgi:transposase
MSKFILPMREDQIAPLDYNSKDLGHLGIVATVCREIGLADEIDRIVGVDPRQKVTCGGAVVAMVLNALGFVDRPLYLFPEFMATKPVELLIGKGLKVEWFNDDVLGRTLDKLYRAGPEAIYMQITSKAYGEYSGRFLHNDTSSINLQGEYKHEEGDLDAVPIEITHGFSKDGRPDLKQFVLSLVMSDSLPVFIKAFEAEYGGVKQRWVVVFSEKAFARETKTQKKKIEKEKEQVEKAVWHFSNQEFHSDEEALKAYKDQQHAERGFRFLKYPLFFAHSLFLKNESRIVAMVMIMGLALMIYGIAERKLREALEKESETIPDQKNKPTKKPTIRRVFQVFEGITVLYCGSKMVKIMNLRPIHLKVLSLLGREYERMYCTSYG